jgi:hypothetical protein
LNQKNKTLEDVFEEIVKFSDKKEGKGKKGGQK